ncbi:MAG: hypothetical protein ACRCYX_04860 [Dermatophilaceae bacterium]
MSGRSTWAPTSSTGSGWNGRRWSPRCVPHGSVITVDGIHTQTDTATAILAAGAHYVFTIKANQPTLHDAAKNLPWSTIPVGATSTDAGYGRRARRTIKVIDIPDLSD